MRSSGIVGSHIVMLSRSVPAKTATFPDAPAIDVRSRSGSSAARAHPSNSTVPFHVSSRPSIRSVIVDFPQPEAPINATILPGAISNESPSNRGGFNVSKPKETSLSSIEPPRRSIMDVAVDVAFVDSSLVPCL